MIIGWGVLVLDSYGMLWGAWHDRSHCCDKSISKEKENENMVLWCVFYCSLRELIIVLWSSSSFDSSLKRMGKSSKNGQHCWNRTSERGFNKSAQPNSFGSPILALGRWRKLRACSSSSERSERERETWKLDQVVTGMREELITRIQSGSWWWSLSIDEWCLCFGSFSRYSESDNEMFVFSVK